VRLYETQSVKELRQLCRDRRIPVSGLKTEVAQRLVDFDDDVQATFEHAGLLVPGTYVTPRLSPRRPPSN